MKIIHSIFYWLILQVNWDLQKKTFVILQLEFCHYPISLIFFSNVYWKNSYFLIISPKISRFHQPTPMKIQYHPHHWSYSNLCHCFLGQTASHIVFFLSLILRYLSETFNTHDSSIFQPFSPHFCQDTSLAWFPFCFPNLSSHCSLLDLPPQFGPYILERSALSPLFLPAILSS